MIAFSLILLIGNPEPSPLQTLDGHARRGAVIARLDGLAAQSSQACQSACRLDAQCQAWTWHTAWIDQAARCDIHALALNPRLHPGAVTGLSPALSSRIDAAMDRPPTARELPALDEASRARPDPGDDLDGG